MEGKIIGSDNEEEEGTMACSKDSLCAATWSTTTDANGH